jgi:hypothetical protein
MSRNAIIAEAIRELAEGQEEANEKLSRQNELLEDIKRILAHTVDGHNEHRAHVRDGMDRLGTRLLRTENRVAALESNQDVSED